MANYNNPNGAQVLTPGARIREYAMSGASKAGDFAARVAEEVVLFNPSTHSGPCGIFAADGVDGELVKVYDDLDNLRIRIQVAGATYAKATHDGNRYGIAGGTGVQYCNLAATTPHLEVVGHSPVLGAEDVGNYARVECRVLSLTAGLALFSAHVDGGASKHDASEIDFELADLSRSIIEDASDTVELALIDLDTALGTVTNDGDGYTAVADAAALTSPAAGTGAGADGTTFSGAQCDAVVADITELRTQLNALLARLRVTAGAGILAD